MVDAIVSVVVERLAATLEEQIRNRVNLARGVENEILKLSDELSTVRNVLDDAEKKGYKDKSVKDWLLRLENTSYEMDDVLDEWNISIIKLQTREQKVWSTFVQSPSLFFKKAITRHDIALKIKEVKARLDLILVEKDRFGFVTSQPADHSFESRRVQSTSLIDLEEICGRDLEREDLVRKLVGEGGIEEDLGVGVLSIVGVGGLGKTTLAKLAYNDSRVENCFELRIWICVSDPFDEVEIAKGIVESMKREKCPNNNRLEMVLQFLKLGISGKKFLLVLNDVWTEDYTKWESLKTCLKCGGGGSKILVTTRNKRVALMMGTVENEIHHLGHLSHEDCWLLLSRIAFSGKNKEECEKFHDIGKNIAKKCNGLPLAAKALGSLLRFKNTLEDWETVLNSEIWELEEVEVDLFPHLLMSYNELSPVLKRCFSYCAVFPKDSLIGVESLIRRWMAMGYLGSGRSNGETDDWRARGREYFDKLATRSLVQDFVKCDLHERIDSFRMHDIVHDFARFLIKKNGGLMKKLSCQTCSALLVSHVKEYRSLFRYKELVDPHLCDCLTSLRMLSLRECGLKSIPKEIEKLIHLRWLDLGRNKISNENLKSICKLYNLQFLWMDRCELQEIPHKLGNLIHLIHLDLGNNKFSAQDLETICKLYNLQFLSVDRCELQEIPQEIGDLIQLMHLDLSHNKLLKELPESICGLRELESLNVEGCTSLCGLPQGINTLVNLKHLYNYGIDSPRQFHQGIAELTNLVTLKKFLRCDGSKLGWLKNLNRLSGSLKLTIELSVNSLEEVVDDAREAELRKKMHIQNLQIHFSGSTGEVKAESIWMGLVEALEPNSNLKNLEIWHYKGSRFPRWIASPLNQLRSIKLGRCEFLSSLPSLGKLPLLENFEIWTNSELQFVGREFLGITTTTTTTTTAAATRGIHSKEESSLKTCTNGFPKLHALKFYNCSEWKEWEDITAEDEEEEYSGGVTFMPCLAELTIVNCKGLAELPHRLLRKAASSLKVLDIFGSTQLEQVYGNKEGRAWSSISHHNPQLNLLL